MLEHVEHSVLHSAPADLSVVLLRAVAAERGERALAAARAVLVHVAGLVEPRVASDWLADHDVEWNALNNLEQRRHLRVPPGTLPRPEQRKTDLAILVKVGIEAHGLLAGGDQGTLGRDLWVLRRDEDVEFEAAVLV